MSKKTLRSTGTDSSPDRAEQERRMISCRELSREAGTVAACGSLDIARPTYYRRFEPKIEQTPAPRPAPPRALSVNERQAVLDVLHSDRFVDQAPTEVYATLLDEGTYHCSVRTMYRILDDAGEVRERRDQARHPHYKAPELLATAPNQVWSWDITKLLGPVKWTYFYLLLRGGLKQGIGGRIHHGNC